MSGKDKNCSKNKHYSTIERKIFLQILEQYKHVIEIKKSDGTTLKEKETAWSEICTKYNNSSLIEQERTVQQLKKLWANLKQGQREALTKERQARLATGGGPQEHESIADPDIANITPNLMKTAPCQFSSNMSESCLNSKRNLAYELISNDQDTVILQYNEDENSIENDKCDNELDIPLAMSIDTDDNTENDINISNISRDKPKETPKENIDSANLTCNNMAYTGIMRQEKRCKKARSTQIYDISSVEKKLRVERLQNIIKQEQQLAEQKLQYEKVLFKIKEDHLQEINKLELNHIKETHNIQLKIQKMKLKILEYELSEKKKNHKV